MAKSVKSAILGIEIGILVTWLLQLRYEAGIDSLLYHAMASAVVRNGRAPWTLNPLSYLGLYPGSDSSSIPFLAADLALVSGIPLDYTIIAYNAILLLTLGLGLFILIRHLTNRADLAVLAVLLGSLAFGFYTTDQWNLDERSFNVALTPLFVYLALPRGRHFSALPDARRGSILGVISLLMATSHLSFLLLLPVLVLVPLTYGVAIYQFRWRRHRWASGLFFGAVVAAPLALLFTMSQVGVLAGLKLQYSLENSAFFSGDSPIIFFLNSFIFIATRAGPVIVVCAAIGLCFLATQRALLERPVLIGSLLLAGFLGIPLVLYSKDLLTPILVVPAIIGIGRLAEKTRKRSSVLVVAALMVVAGSATFNVWNASRTSARIDATYWTERGITPDATNTNLWIAIQSVESGCVYGNNWLAVRQVSVSPSRFVCGDSDVAFVLRQAILSPGFAQRFEVEYVGVFAGQPQNWFRSPMLERVTQDFARVPQLSFSAGRDLLMGYGVQVIIVDLQKPEQVPLYLFEGTTDSRFFRELWQNGWAAYKTSRFAVFYL